MKHIVMLSILFVVACTNPAGIGNQTIPDGQWDGTDQFGMPVSSDVGCGHVQELSWISVCDSTLTQAFTAPPLPLRPHIEFDTTSAYGQTVHIEADWRSDDSTWAGWHQVQGLEVVAFTLYREG